MPKISKFSAKKWMITSLTIYNIHFSYFGNLHKIFKIGDIIKLSFEWLISKSIFAKLKIKMEQNS